MRTRRQFLRDVTLASSGLSWIPSQGRAASADPQPETASFFVVGDTHYCADESDHSVMDETSARYNARLVHWLNQLPGSAIPAEAGGGVIQEPHGVIHVGDIVDNADKGPRMAKMVDTELAAFLADYGLNGTEGKLRWPVREVHGNHDGPHGDTAVVREIIARNQRRAGLLKVSDNGLHYSWDWAGVHFVALGIVVGDSPEVTRKRRYAPMGSLPFLERDLAEHVGESGRPVVLVHHVDVHRYSTEVPDEKVKNHEWDYGDAQAFYRALRPYRIAGSFCGHTHARRLVRWDGTGDAKTKAGIPFLNTDNAGHFGSPSQAFLHISVSADELAVREFATRDGWETGAWTPQRWSYDLGA